MIKAYIITPEEYKKKQDEIRKIEYRYAYQCGPGHCQTRLSRTTPEKVRKRYEKLKAEVNAAVKPNDSLFFENTDIYNLWLCRDTDQPITARELYNIVSAVRGKMARIEEKAWDF